MTQAADNLADLARVILARLDLDAGERGESCYLPEALREHLRLALAAYDADRKQQGGTP